MKKKHIVITAVVVIALGYGFWANSSKDETQDTTAQQTQITKSEQMFVGGGTDLEKSDTEEKKDTEQPTETAEQATEEVAHRTGDNIIGVSDKDITAVYSTKYDTVRNDVTGNWKCIVLAENNFNIEEYALSCYKNYFDSDKTILAVENLTTKTSASISNVSGLVYVSVYEYTDGEEHDAKAMFSGMHLADYIIYTDNGDIEKVTDSE